MTPEIERLAKEAGLDAVLALMPDEASKFANLLAEECAKECEGEEDRGYKIAAAIRAKFALSDLKDAAK